MSALDNARAWVQTHQGQAAAGAGGVLVAGYALWKRRSEGSGEDAEDPQAGTTAAAGGTDPNLVTAGLSGTPNTSSTDIETWVQQQLNDQDSKFQDQLDAAKPAPAPKPVTPQPAPRPGASKYTVVSGDTLRKVAQKVYGRSTTTAITDLKRGNPYLWGWGADAPMTVLVGRYLVVPKPSKEPVKKPAAKPPKKRGSSKPPRRPRPPKKKK